ncbi:hypothetical protein AZE42_13198 [Rhizopogon vesiculosus]|uniref:Ndc10 domain-containing protein n=1 Tax=Rhizopogon vesiculosus TaxID=180088 RepID=A0A1J8PWC7_9AGAM|nr:hypothetical protein AZE42_13198 [Rhizopogon vesiculosus]
MCIEHDHNNLQKRQSGSSDPEQALLYHLRINELPPRGAFDDRFKNGHRSLTKQKFMARLVLAARAAGMDHLQGHGIRIGSTLEYLPHNVPFEVVKMKGRRSSDAFHSYLQKHAQIMALYTQAAPAPHEDFLRFAKPKTH